MSDPLRLYLRFLVGLLLASALLPAAAQPRASAQASAQASEMELKAAYLYRFLSFVEWPAQRFASPEAPIVIAVAGADELAEELEKAVHGRLAQSRAVEVRVLAKGEAARGAHVLYVGDEAAERLPALARGADFGTLVVADGAQALDRGAAIGFVQSQGRLRFAVALDAAEQAGLRINSRMLAVASEVRTRRP